MSSSAPPEAPRTSDRDALQASPIHPPGHDALWRVGIAVAGDGPVQPAAEVGPGVRIFHDGAPDAVQLWPVAGGIGIALGDFEGTYVSLALALPDAVFRGLSSRHVLRLALRASLSAPIMRARVNLRCGPNVSRMLRKLEPDRTHLVSEHDLWHLAFDEALLREAWVDILIEPMRRGRFAIEEVTLSRRWRAEV